jgi:hypothetical protein
MVKSITTYQFPQRKNEFREMVGQMGLIGGSSKRAQQFLWLGNTLKRDETASLFLEDPDRWTKFQKEYKEEFNDKIKLITRIRDKKIGFEPFYWLFSTE